MFQVIDMHCDTIPALQWKEKQEHLADADLQINLDKLEKGGSLCQCFSLFTFLKGLKDETPFEHVRKLADLWKSEVERYPDRICQIKTDAGTEGRKNRCGDDRRRGWCLRGKHREAAYAV